jgi:hypothetical protein
MRPTRAGVLFAVLFAAALATAVLVLATRTPDLVLEVRRLPSVLTPNGDGVRDKAEITFLVREDDPHASVSIVGKDLVLIKTLDDDVALEAEKPVTYLWDGTDDAGDPAPVGRYRLRVELPDRDRDMVFPRRMGLNRPPPHEDEG